MMKLAENIRALRKAKNINQSALAEAVFTTVKTISHWETGYTEPSVNQLILLADYFDISIDELVGREN